MLTMNELVVESENESPGKLGVEPTLEFYNNESSVPRHDQD